MNGWKMFHRNKTQQNNRCGYLLTEGTCHAMEERKRATLKSSYVTKHIVRIEEESFYHHSIKVVLCGLCMKYANICNENLIKNLTACAGLLPTLLNLTSQLTALPYTHH